MENIKINVNGDIRLAETLPAKFYKDKILYDLSKKKIFLKEKVLQYYMEGQSMGIMLECLKK